MESLYKLGDNVTCKDGRFGRVSEITLFRREDSIGYGIVNAGRKFFVGEESILTKGK